MAEKRAKSEDTSSAKREKEDKTVSQEQKYEYLDHTADVQLHAWGDDLKEAFEQCGVAMFGYMTELETVEEGRTDSIEAEGDDMISLLYHFLDEFLFLFCAEPYFIIKRIRITEFDKINFKIKAEGYGETFDLSKHPQGTEVKAITYSNMQIYDEEGKHEVYYCLQQDTNLNAVRDFRTHSTSLSGFTGGRISIF